MANILITEKCNRKCTFCFARNRLMHSKQQEKNMSMENILKVFSFLKRSGSRELRLLGGEPTLHPKIKEIISLSLESDFRIFFFSNCIMSPDLTDFIADIPADKINFLCNISPQASDTEKQIEYRSYALEKLGSQMTLGITVTEPQIEYDFLLDTIEKFNLRKHIRVGVAQPIVGHDNSFLDPDQYKAAGTAIVEMAKACEKKDVLIGFDCGMTLCMFSEDELGILMTRSEGFKSDCGPIIDIGVNLEVWSCFPLSGVLVSHLDDFENRDAIEKAYIQALAPYRSLGCRTQCLSCKYKKREQCFGGCLVHTINQLNKPLPERMIRQ